MLLSRGRFRGASGQFFPFKIECDALDAEDWVVVSEALRPRLAPFCCAIGVPTGGVQLALMLNRFRSPRKLTRTLLVVDDVWSTGGSMRKFAEQYLKDNPGKFDPRWHGAVAFSRGPRPVHVSAFMQLTV